MFSVSKSFFCNMDCFCFHKQVTFLFKNKYKSTSVNIRVLLPTANTVKSMLQQFDSQLSAKDYFLHDQQSKLNEKDKVILSQKTEIERLEKKSKTLEYKVLSSFYN